MVLIGLSGKARSGKDTVGKYITEKYNLKSYAIADPLKRACSEMFGIPLDHFYDDDKKDVVNEFWQISPRKIAQLLGTQGGRKLFHPDIWVKRAELVWIEHKENIKTDGLVITDVRFNNEAVWIKKENGITIDIIRQSAGKNVAISNHESEAGLSHHLKTHIVYNDGSFEDLYNKIDNIMLKLMRET